VTVIETRTGSLNRRRRLATGRRNGLPCLERGSAGLAVGVLAVVTLVGCSSGPSGGAQSPPVPSTSSYGPVVTPTGSAQPTSVQPQDTASAPSAATGPSGAQVDVVRVEKCWTTATPSHGGQLLVKASSSDPAAHLLVYGSDGSLIGEVQNGGGGRYGGSVMPYQRIDPVRCVVKSSVGGTSSAPTGPFQPES